MSNTQGNLKGKSAQHIDLGVYGMEVSLVDPEEREIIHPQGDLIEQFGGGAITSALKDQFMPDTKELAEEFRKTALENIPVPSKDYFELCPDCQTSKPVDGECPCCGVEVAKAEASADALESFILALACEGYDVKDSAFICALEVATEAIANNL